jgi:SAM-dependent methyltransferase
MNDLHEMNPVGRFDDRAEDYVRYRPGYPAGAIDAVLEGLGPPDRLMAADVGAGTGISARLVADRGVDVIAVEPGAAMRRAADAHRRVRWIAASAEATGLSPASFDLLLCAQSFHWFRPRAALEEFARVLRPGGRLALMWNRRSRTDPFTAAYRQAILDASGEACAERMDFQPEIVALSGLYSPVDRKSVPNSQRLDLAGLIGRCHSASYVPKDGVAGERLRRALRTLHGQYADADGFVTLVYETELFRAWRL